ncbi:hypothetical protein PQX77_016400 [Marasmius sp. AFHP31]|nr:hypothetical protein PQX77_016400 [Marasmius sp. AFHP31]
MFATVPQTFCSQASSTNASQNRSTEPPSWNAQPRSLEYGSMGSGGGQPAGPQSNGSSSSNEGQWPTWGVPSAAPLPTARFESPNHSPFSSYDIAHSEPSEYHGHELQAGLPQTQLSMSHEEWADWARSADIDLSVFSIGSQLPAASQSSSHYSTSPPLNNADEIEAAIAALLAPGPAMSSLDPLPSQANGTSQQGPIGAFAPSDGSSGSYRQAQGWVPSQPAHRPYGGNFNAMYTASPALWQSPPTAPPALHPSTSTYPSGLFSFPQQPPQPQPQLLSWPRPLQQSFQSTHAVPLPQSTQGSRVPGPSSRQNDRQAPYKKAPRPARPVHRKAAAQASGSNSPSMGTTPSDTASSSGGTADEKWPTNLTCYCGHQFEVGNDSSIITRDIRKHFADAHNFSKPPNGSTACPWLGCNCRYSTPKDFERHFFQIHFGREFICRKFCKGGFGRSDQRKVHESNFCKPPKPESAV